MEGVPSGDLNACLSQSCHPSLDPRRTMEHFVNLDVVV